MKKTKILSAAFALGLLAASCEKDKNKAGLFKGPEVDMGHGKAYAWVKLDNDSKPLAVGITLTKSAVDQLPDHGGDASHHMNEFILPMPEQAGTTAFKHVMVNWNPEGHEPAGIYDVPHFDFHFYTIASQERQLIAAWEVDSAKFKNVPGPAYFPNNYLYLGGGIPQMGAHLIDITSPELHGNPFKETFIYGSFNGKVIFLETMVEMNYFQGAQVNREVPRPAKVQQTGYYPKHYQVIKDNSSYSIVFDSMEYRTAE
jgi:hypothetical protein